MIGPNTIRTRRIAISFTASGSVWSWICVTACRMPTTRPSTTAAASAGPDTTSTVIRAALTLAATSSECIATSTAHLPENARPGLDPGWERVFRKKTCKPTNPTRRSAVAEDQAVQQARPPFHGDEQQKLERHRDERRRHHDHAHRHQHI